MLNVETESTKINILSSQLLIFSYVSTDYMLVKLISQGLTLAIPINLLSESLNAYLKPSKLLLQMPPRLQYGREPHCWFFSFKISTNSF